VKSGVYEFRSKVDGKVYVGSSHDLARRYTAHLLHLRRGDHKNIHLQRAWNKYGESNFTYKVLEYCAPEIRTDVETVWINVLQAADSEYGYNIKLEGRMNSGVNVECRQRMSEAWYRHGVTLTPAGRKKISETHTGVVFTQERRSKISDRRKAYLADPKHREELSQTVKDSGVAEVLKRPDVVKNRLAALRSSETRQKMSESRLAYHNGQLQRPLTENEVVEAKELWRRGRSCRQLQRRYKRDYATIYKAVTGKEV